MEKSLFFYTSANSKQKVFLRFGFLIFVFLHTNIYAQQACSTNGISISNNAEHGNATYSIGDAAVLNSNIDPSSQNANWLLNNFANVTLYGALEIKKGAVVRLKSGARLSIYGDVINRGHLIVEPEAEIKFYGARWFNDTGSSVQDGSLVVDTFTGGVISFIAPRPSIPLSASPSACVLANYNGGDFSQTIQGGDVPMDVHLVIRNSNNIHLDSTALKIEGRLVFASDDGDLVLDSTDLYFTPNGKYYWEIPDVRNAFIITNGSAGDALCSGMVYKYGLDSGDYFVFPIGRQEQISTAQRGLSPILVQNLSPTNDWVKVDVLSYQEAQAMGIPTPPIPSQAALNHLWRINTSSGGAISANMLHFVPIATSDLLPQFVESSLNNVGLIGANGVIDGGGPRGLGSGAGGVGGNVQGSVYEFKSSSPNCNDKESWFVKELSTSTIDFTIDYLGCAFKIDIHLALLQHLPLTLSVNRANELGNFVPIGNMTKIGEGHYEFVDMAPLQNAENRYWLSITSPNIIDMASDTLSRFMDCSKIVVFPNPASEQTAVYGLAPGMQLMLYSAEGKMLWSTIASKACEQVSLAPFAKGVYFLKIVNNNRVIFSSKLVKY